MHPNFNSFFGNDGGISPSPYPELTSQTTGLPGEGKIRFKSNIQTPLETPSQWCVPTLPGIGNSHMASVLEEPSNIGHKDNAESLQDLIRNSPTKSMQQTAAIMGSPAKRSLSAPFQDVISNEFSMHSFAGPATMQAFI